MRVMLMIKGDPEPGAAPSDEPLAAMGSYNDELNEAGVLVDLAGLYPSGDDPLEESTAEGAGLTSRPVCSSTRLKAGGISTPASEYASGVDGRRCRPGPWRPRMTQRRFGTT
jgi:hypothetical protein